MNQSEFHRLIKDAEHKLREAGIESAAAEVEISLLALLDLERVNLYLHGAELIDDGILTRFREVIDKRTTQYPLQYILGEMWFYGRRFTVNPNVMIPTPETEILCETAIHYIDFREINAAKILDIGTGSGVISVTMACEVPDAIVTATDISKAALKTAAQNAGLHEVDERIGFVCSDMFCAFNPEKQFDLILSNPPYIADDEYDGLPPEVLADPKISLVAGDKGMDVIEALVASGPDYLVPGGRLMFEIGCNQAELVTRLTNDDYRYISMTILKDLNDIDRVVILGI
ncbi:MAG: peptide chain release factor N(5)-glutamine methyltransferase [Candidatus Zixiibacteriota bacterium]|nr:MAG: peptide chain release factor N(5)-glutamine methyltransferase [candidate division Zixibacteria bacterium]